MPGLRLLKTLLPCQPEAVEVPERLMRSAVLCQGRDDLEDSPSRLRSGFRQCGCSAIARMESVSYEISRDSRRDAENRLVHAPADSLAMKDDAAHKFGFGGPVEADETYIGPNPKEDAQGRKARYQAQARRDARHMPSARLPFTGC